MRLKARDLLPRVARSHWSGDALTIDPDGGVELPPGIARSLRLAFGNPTTTPEHDEAAGSVFILQWFGIIVELAVGRVR